MKTFYLLTILACTLLACNYGKTEKQLTNVKFEECVGNDISSVLDELRLSFKDFLSINNLTNKNDFSSNIKEYMLQVISVRQSDLTVIRNYEDERLLEKRINSIGLIDSIFISYKSKVSNNYLYSRNMSSCYLDCLSNMPRKKDSFLDKYLELVEKDEILPTPNMAHFVLTFAKDEDYEDEIFQEIIAIEFYLSIFVTK